MSNLTKADATKLARELAARLGKGWVPDVQQNIDWHYGAKIVGEVAGAGAEVLANPRFGATEYTIYMRVGPLETCLTGPDPVKLMSDAKKEMDAKVRAIESSFNQLIHLTM
jgi:hypothetical protein